MSLFRTTKSLGADRPSVLVQVRFRDKEDEPLEAESVWLELKALFKNHPNLELYKAEIRPDKDEKTSISEE